MSKIAVLIDKKFEDTEYSEPVNAFERHGHEIFNIGLETGKVVKGRHHQAEVRIHHDVKTITPNDFDALLIPGGDSPDHLQAREGAVAFTRYFMDRNKPVFSFCRGHQLLISADALTGRKLTAETSIIADIKNAGGEFVDSNVVKDGNLITGRDRGELPRFIDVSLEQLKETE